jgi:hypothetical protein
MVTSIVLARHIGRSRARSRLAEALAAVAPVEPGTEGVHAVEPWLSGCGYACDGAYSDFIDRHTGKKTTLARDHVKRLLALTEAAPEARRIFLDSTTLRARIREALVVNDLLEGLPRRPLLVATLGERSANGIVERRLLFGDPEVGSFEALLLSPIPHNSVDRTLRPAVIGLHGHRDTAESFAEENMGRELARRGFFVLIPNFRAHDCSLFETRIALELLESGYTLMGLKIYETLLMSRFLESLGQVDKARVALLAHSGGSSIADLAVRVSDSFAAKVIDLRINYRDRCGLLGTHCQTIPALFPLSAELASDDRLGIPTLEVPYKFEAPAVKAQIVKFLETAFGDE